MNEQKKKISRPSLSINEDDDSLTQIQVKKSTRKLLKLFKASADFRTYDEAIRFLIEDFLQKEENCS
ncbi:MAG: hypothetical protein ACTSVI_05360 [Promethearchaeota archaeon]